VSTARIARLPVQHPSVVHYHELAAEPPEWVIDCAERRNTSYMRKNHETPPRLTLVWQWTLDYCGLPARHRRLLEVVARLSNGAWPIHLIAERVGADPGNVRRMIDELVEWDWLEIERPGRPQPNRYYVTIPVDKPPDRVATGKGKRT
jgi:hypothetical protein